MVTMTPISQPRAKDLTHKQLRINRRGPAMRLSNLQFRIRGQKFFLCAGITIQG
jgi:hypothetical protein